MATVAMTTTASVGSEPLVRSPSLFWSGNRQPSSAGTSGDPDDDPDFSDGAGDDHYSDYDNLTDDDGLSSSSDGDDSSSGKALPRGSAPLAGAREHADKPQAGLAALQGVGARRVFTLSDLMRRSQYARRSSTRLRGAEGSELLVAGMGAVTETASDSCGTIHHVIGEIKVGHMYTVRFADQPPRYGFKTSIPARTIIESMLLDPIESADVCRAYLDEWGNVSLTQPTQARTLMLVRCGNAEVDIVPDTHPGLYVHSVRLPQQLSSSSPSTVNVSPISQYQWSKTVEEPAQAVQTRLQTVQAKVHDVNARQLTSDELETLFAPPPATSASDSSVDTTDGTDGDTKQDDDGADGSSSQSVGKRRRRHGARGRRLRRHQPLHHSGQDHVAALTASQRAALSADARERRRLVHVLTRCHAPQMCIDDIVLALTRPESDIHAAVRALGIRSGLSARLAWDAIGRRLVTGSGAVGTRGHDHRAAATKTDEGANGGTETTKPASWRAMTRAVNMVRARWNERESGAKQRDHIATLPSSSSRSKRTSRAAGGASVPPPFHVIAPMRLLSPLWRREGFYEAGIGRMLFADSDTSYQGAKSDADSLETTHRSPGMTAPSSELAASEEIERVHALTRRIRACTDIHLCSELITNACRELQQFAIQRQRHDQQRQTQASTHGQGQRRLRFRALGDAPATPRRRRDRRTPSLSPLEEAYIDLDHALFALASAVPEVDDRRPPSHSASPVPICRKLLMHRQPPSTDKTGLHTHDAVPVRDGKAPASTTGVAKAAYTLPVSAPRLGSGDDSVQGNDTHADAEACTGKGVVVGTNNKLASSHLRALAMQRAQAQSTLVVRALRRFRRARDCPHSLLALACMYVSAQNSVRDALQSMLPRASSTKSVAPIASSALSKDTSDAVANAGSVEALCAAVSSVQLMPFAEVRAIADGQAPASPRRENHDGVAQTGVKPVVAPSTLLQQLAMERRAREEKGRNTAASASVVRTTSAVRPSRQARKRNVVSESGSSENEPEPGSSSTASSDADAASTTSSRVRLTGTRRTTRHQRLDTSNTQRRYPTRRRVAPKNM